MSQTPPVRPLLSVVLLAACAIGAQAQTAPPDTSAAHAVPFGSSGNVIELEVVAADAAANESFDVVVASAPAWLQFHAARQPAEGQAAEGQAAVARLAFDVARTAPVGEVAEVTLHVVAGEAVVARRVVRLAVSAPAALSLGAPYPNPSRGAVAVPFEVPSAGRVRLVAYDVLGREVAVLADGEREAGAHQARLEAGALAAGVYVVRLVVGDEARVHRLTVVR